MRCCGGILPVIIMMVVVVVMTLVDVGKAVLVCDSEGGAAADMKERLPPGPLKWVLDGGGGGGDNDVQRKAVATGKIRSIQRSRRLDPLVFLLR